MISIRLYDNSDKQLWDTYVMLHPDATHCHLSGWKDVIENAYGHKGYYLMAEQPSANPINSINPTNSINSTIGILPLIHIKSILFGNQLVSMPFLNYGGILADNEETENALLSEAVKLGQKLKASTIELRHLNPLTISLPPTSSDLPAESLSAKAGAILPPLTEVNPINSMNTSNPINYSLRTHKVRMLLELPESSDKLFKSYNAKLRSQIRRPQKEGMDSVIGGAELLNDFYKVFSINMRDLGSPVHSRSLFKEIVNYFSENVKIGIVSYKDQAVAVGIIICFRDIVEIPWASSLRKYNQFSPNMFLYWSFLEYSCENGLKYFDFGRSTPGEGTYKFKEQWGSKASQLYWYSFRLDGKFQWPEILKESRYRRFERVWSSLPVVLTTAIGPLLRKRVAL